jgi:hypothetical protein
MIAPQFELQPSPSEKTVINAACAAKPESVTGMEGENSLSLYNWCRAFCPPHDMNLFPVVALLPTSCTSPLPPPVPPIQLKSKKKFLLLASLPTVRANPSMARSLLVHEHLIFISFILRFLYLALDIVLHSRMRCAAQTESAICLQRRI